MILMLKKYQLLVFPVVLALVFGGWMLKIFYDMSVLQRAATEQLDGVLQLGKVEEDIRELHEAFITSVLGGQVEASNWAPLYAPYWERISSLHWNIDKRNDISVKLVRLDELMSRIGLNHAVFLEMSDTLQKDDIISEGYLETLEEALAQAQGIMEHMRERTTQQHVVLDQKWQQLKVLIWVSCLLILLSALLLDGYRRANIERRRIREDLKASEARFRRLFESADMGIGIASPEGKFLEANPALQRMLGYSAEELCALNFTDVIYPKDLPLQQEQMHRIVPEEWGGYQIEQRFIRKDGSVFWGQSSFTVAGDKASQYNFAMIEDITARKRDEQQLLEAKEQAEEMARVKSIFLANINHEVRTPLAVMLICASMLREVKASQQEELILDIQKNGARLRDMLDKVLQFSKIEGRTLQLEPKLVDVGAYVHEVVGEVAAVAREKGLALVYHAPLKAIRTKVDRISLHRIVGQLVDNALKFTQKGQVAITVESDEALIYIHVRDTGEGISPSFIPHLFEAFRQESVGDTRTHEGAGLGLAITKQLVDLMDGTIAVKSEKGQGSHFTVMFPREIQRDVIPFTRDPMRSGVHTRTPRPKIHEPISRGGHV